MKKKSRQKCLGWCAAWVSFVTCNTSQPAVMIDILMDPLAWAVLLSQNAASCLDTICCSHFNSYDRCEKPFLSKHQEGLSKPLVHSISYSKIIFLKLELVHVGLLHWHDWHSIFPKLRVEFLLPPILGRWNLEGNWIYWPVKAKSFAPSSRSTAHSLPFQSPVSTVFFEMVSEIFAALLLQHPLCLLRTLLAFLVTYSYFSCDWLRNIGRSLVPSSKLP